MKLSSKKDIIKYVVILLVIIGLIYFFNEVFIGFGEGFKTGIGG